MLSQWRRRAPLPSDGVDSRGNAQMGPEGQSLEALGCLGFGGLWKDAFNPLLMNLDLDKQTKFKTFSEELNSD